MATKTTLEKIEEMMLLMEKHAVDEITFDGITLRKSLHKNPPLDMAPVAVSSGPELSAEDQQDMELFGSTVVKRG